MGNARSSISASPPNCNLSLRDMVSPMSAARPALRGAARYGERAGTSLLRGARARPRAGLRQALRKAAGAPPRPGSRRALGEAAAVRSHGGATVAGSPPRSRLRPAAPQGQRLRGGRCPSQSSRRRGGGGSGGGATAFFFFFLLGFKSLCFE